MLIYCLKTSCISALRVTHLGFSTSTSFSSSCPSISNDPEPTAPSYPLYQQNYPVGLAVELVIFYMTRPRLWWCWDWDLFLCGISAQGRFERVRILYVVRGEARPQSWIIMIYCLAERERERKKE